MAQLDFKSLLTKFSAELIATGDIRATLDQDVIAAKWLGFAPATASELAECQDRIGMQLPTSFVNFLRASNGWRTTGTFVSKLWPTSEIKWLRDFDPEIIDIWSNSESGDPPLEPHIASCLAISPFDDAICLLNPERKYPNGEWEAWFFANWIPGAHKFRSFSGLFKYLRTDVRRQLSDQKQASRADQSLPSLRELFDALKANRVAGWPDPEKHVDDLLGILEAEVRDPQNRWGIPGQLCSICMTPIQESRFRAMAESDADPKVRKMILDVLKSRSELWG